MTKRSKTRTLNKIISKIAPNLVHCPKCNRWWDKKTDLEIVKRDGCKSCIRVLKNANCRTLKTYYIRDYNNDIKSLYGKNIENELVKILSEEIKNEIDRKILISIDSCEPIKP